MLKNLLAAVVTFYCLNGTAAELDIDPPFEELEPAGSSQNFLAFDPCFLLKELQVYPLTQQRLEADLSQLEKGDVSTSLQQVKTYAQELEYLSGLAVYSSFLLEDKNYLGSTEAFNKIVWNRIYLIQRILSHPYNACQESDQGTLKTFITVNQHLSQKLKQGVCYFGSRQESIDFLNLTGEIFEPFYTPSLIKP